MWTRFFDQRLTNSLANHNVSFTVSVVEDGKPEVYMGDLENAIEYVLTKEIPAKAKLDDLHLNAVFQLLENLIRYLPLRTPLRNFLIALRDWPIRMEFKKVTGQHYADKVKLHSSTEVLDISKCCFLKQNLGEEGPI